MNNNWRYTNIKVTGNRQVFYVYITNILCGLYYTLLGKRTWGCHCCSRLKNRSYILTSTNNGDSFCNSNLFSISTCIYINNIISCRCINCILQCSKWCCGSSRIAIITNYSGKHISTQAVIIYIISIAGTTGTDWLKTNIAAAICSICKKRCIDNRSDDFRCNSSCIRSTKPITSGNWCVTTVTISINGISSCAGNTV